MFRVLLTLIIASTTVACGGADGDPCEPFDNGAKRLLTGCESGLVCVGTKGAGRCVRPDQPSNPAIVAVHALDPPER